MSFVEKKWFGVVIVVNFDSNFDELSVLSREHLNFSVLFIVLLSYFENNIVRSRSTNEREKETERTERMFQLNQFRTRRETKEQEEECFIGRKPKCNQTNNERRWTRSFNLNLVLFKLDRLTISPGLDDVRRNFKIESFIVRCKLTTIFRLNIDG